MANAGKDRVLEPMVVRTHVTPWGFLVALPLALAFAGLGAHILETQIVSGQPGRDIQLVAWLFSIPLFVFALFLFLIGIAELATYLKPSIEVVVDNTGVTTYGVLGARRMPWTDMLRLDIDQGRMTIHGVGRANSPARVLRLQFSRLAVDPAVLVARISAYRPDLVGGQRAG